MQIRLVDADGCAVGFGYLQPQDIVLMELIVAHIKFPCDGFQGQVFRKMAVDICRDAVDLVGDAVEIQVVGVNILIPVKVNQA